LSQPAAALGASDETQTIAVSVRSIEEISGLAANIVSFGPKKDALEEQFANSAKSLLGGDVFAQ
jgi:hypothetical protein